MNKRSIWISCACLGVIMALIYYFIYYAPLVTDNYTFSRDLHEGYAKYYSGEKINCSALTLESAFRQAKQMYFTWCGRFAGNMVVYLLFLLPHWLYCILAAIVFGIYVLLLQMCVFGREWLKNFSPTWLFTIAGLLWLGVPSFGEAFLWLSVGGQVALLGQALFFLPFRFALDGPDDKVHGPVWHATTALLLFFLGIIVTSLDYPSSAALPPTGIACVIWLYFTQNRHKINWPLALLALGSCIGSYFTLTAPGNTQRLALTQDATVHAYLASNWGERLLVWLGSIPWVIWIMFIPLAFLFWGCLIWGKHYKKEWYKHLPTPALLFVFPTLLTYGAYLFTPFPPARAFATISAQLIVCACIMLVLAKPLASASALKQLNILRTILFIVCSLSIIDEGIKFFSLNKIIDEREKILIQSKGKDAVIPRMPFNSHDRYWVLGSLPDATGDPDFWVNRGMALYYGARTIRVKEEKPIIFSTGQQDIFYKNHMLYVKIKDENSVKALDHSPAPLTVHFYYYGKPAWLCKIPNFIGIRVYRWLEENSSDTITMWLVPILLARLDISLNIESEELVGISRPVRIANMNKIWLVKPGAPWYSFDLIPLAAKNQY